MSPHAVTRLSRKTLRWSMLCLAALLLTAFALRKCGAPAPEKPATLGVEKPLTADVRWTAYFITPIKPAAAGTGRTISFESNTGEKTHYTVSHGSFRQGEMEAVAVGVDKNGKKRFGYRVAEGIWKELPEGSMGMGNKMNVLVPLLHVAADQRHYPYGSLVFLPKAVGIQFKGADKPSDGYFWIADTGGGVKGDHFDLFVGEEEVYLDFLHRPNEPTHPTIIYPLPSAPPGFDPRTDAGLAAILRKKGFIRNDNVPSMDALREALVKFQKTHSHIPAAEYGDPDAATTLWFLIQAALEP